MPVVTVPIVAAATTGSSAGTITLHSLSGSWKPGRSYDMKYLGRSKVLQTFRVNGRHDPRNIQVDDSNWRAME